MSATKGYYSIIQYCPDLTRLEAANIGVLLFCPDRRVLAARIAKDNDRIRRFFGSAGHDWKKLTLLKAAFEDRVAAEGGNIRTVDELQRFIDLRANQFRLTPPRSMRVEEPERDLRRLFEELADSASPRREGRRFRHEIAAKFRQAHLERKLRCNIPVHVPILGRQQQFEYGFQNGRFNLIQPASFRSEPSNSLNTACRYAIQGESLYGHEDEHLGQMQLFVVGAFRSKKDEVRRDVARILDTHHVRLLPSWELPELIQEILSTGRDLVEPTNNERTGVLR